MDINTNSMRTDMRLYTFLPEGLIKGLSDDEVSKWHGSANGAALMEFRRSMFTDMRKDMLEVYKETKETVDGIEDWNLDNLYMDYTVMISNGCLPNVSVEDHDKSHSSMKDRELKYIDMLHKERAIFGADYEKDGFEMRYK